MYIPNSAYRIQLRHGTTFQQAAGAVSYLSALGVDAVSVSSPFRSPQTGEGITAAANPTELDPRLGAEAGFVELNAELADAGIHLIVDLNPSKMSATHENAWWFDVLEWGAAAAHARHFDVDWTRPITLPVLNRPMNEEVGAGKFKISFDRQNASLGVTYGDLFYPLSPLSYRKALHGVVNQTAISFIEAADKATPDASARLRSDLLDAFDNAEVVDRLDIASALNAVANDADRLTGLLSLQNWMLAETEGASELINYRHAADSRLMVGLRMEDPEVFGDFHNTPFSLLEKTQVRGFRVNDVDELADPKEYTKRLREEVGEDTFVVTDKILLGGETYEDDWQVNGTAGYEFISTAADILVDHAGLSELQRRYESELDPGSELSGDYRRAKADILHAAFPEELETLAGLLARLSPLHAEEFPLRRAIAELIVGLPVYRTYIDDGTLSEFYQDTLENSATQLSSREGHVPGVGEAVACIVRVLSGENPDSERATAGSFRTRFQQLSAAVMAQAIEKSYTYARGPIALDELILGSAATADPVKAFHAKMVERASSVPTGLLTTTFSYATKFGEDARMRLLALSEAPHQWASAVEGWQQRQAGNRAVIEDVVVPDPQTEWLIYQTLAAIWPVSLRIDDAVGVAAIRDELSAFIEHAIQESEKRSFWTGINKPYGQAVTDYLDRLSADRDFLADFVETMKPFWLAGALNSFAQTVLKLTVPGVPVIYGGAETWDLSVSPSSSRRAVNFEGLRNQLTNADQSPLDLLLEDWESGAVKQRLVKSHLRARQTRHALFCGGEYIPLKVTGEQAEHIVAFCREFEGQYALVAVPRLCFEMLKPFNRPFLPLPEWEGTFLLIPDELIGTTFRHVMTDKTLKLKSRLPLADVLREFPVMTLLSEPQASSGNRD